MAAEGASSERFLVCRGLRRRRKGKCRCPSPLAATAIVLLASDRTNPFIGAFRAVVVDNSPATTVSGGLVVASSSAGRKRAARNHLQHRSDRGRRLIWYGTGFGTAIRGRRTDTDREDEDLPSAVVRGIDGFLGFASRPTPGIPSLALGIPLSLLVTVAFVPAFQGFLTVLLFAAFAGFGRAVVLAGDDDDGDDEEQSTVAGETLKVDLLSLPAAIVSAALLAPPASGTSVVPSLPLSESSSSAGLLVAGPLLLLGLAVVAVRNQPSSALRLPDDDESGNSEDDDEDDTDRRLLDLWDQQYRKNESSSSKNNGDG